MRRLLTTKGDELVDAVSAALGALGFEIRPVDADPARRGDRLEDLQVTDPDAPQWVALVEVRGYGRNAAVKDMWRLDRFTLRFHQEHGRPPSVRWYVVNQRHEASAADRPVPLHANPADVELFAGEDGAVIDTRTLFRLVVTLADAEPARLAAVRSSLRARRGVWPLDETAADPS